MRRPLLWLLILLTTGLLSGKKRTVKDSSKIDGINLVAPRNPIKKDAFLSLEETNAKWVSVIPYGFVRPDQGVVVYSFDRQWWGEGVVGAVKTIKMAQELGYKVMLKPHVWVTGQGWAGDFDLETEATWKKWEDSYQKYIEQFARIADSLNVELFCVGTEFRNPAVKRPEYWRQLIYQVRKTYKGAITYAANWDNYEKISFWDDLDFIGIDAYFPVCSQKTPSKESVSDGWKQITNSIEKVSDEFNKSVIFTEYGYRSVDFAADGHWKYNRDTLNVNNEAQTNAYRGMYQAVWEQPWFEGGFLWKWHLESPRRPDRLLKEFTPQNKPAIEVIKERYK